MRRRLSPGAGALLTFVAAASVLVLEIAAGRLLAPYVGVSLTTYTGIIGVILGGIAAGAWAGGKAADRFGAENLIGPTLVLGGLASMASVPVVNALGPANLGSDLAAIVILAAIGFLAPAAILSAVAPMIVRASLVDIASSGSLVGRLSAIGTAGAIFGTFLTGFVLLGLVPTRPLILATGGFIGLVGVALTLWLGRSGGRGSTALLGAIAIVAAGAFTAAVPGPCQRESRYYCIGVIPDPDPALPNGRILVLDNLWHAFVDLGDPSRIQFGYVRWFRAATERLVEESGDGLRALHVGGGGFSFPRYLRTAAPGSHHTVLELDPTILDVAQKQLGPRPDDQLRVVLGDARRSILDQPADSFEIVVGEAFAALSVPWHLTTREFLAEVDRVVAPGGRYVMNVIDERGLRFARAEAATLRTLFEHVAVLGLPAVMDGSGGGGNLVLVASHEPISLADLRARSAALNEPTTVIGAGEGLEAFVAGAPVLTDDFAPVDQLIGR